MILSLLWPCCWAGIIFCFGNQKRESTCLPIPILYVFHGGFLLPFTIHHQFFKRIIKEMSCNHVSTKYGNLFSFPFPHKGAMFCYTTPFLATCFKCLTSQSNKLYARLLLLWRIMCLFRSALIYFSHKHKVFI